MKTKLIKLLSSKGEGHILVSVKGNQVIINRRGFIPVKETWLEEMNPARVKAWYHIPDKLNVC